MKTITLKLTKPEIDSIWGSTNSSTLAFFRLMECYDKNETFTHHECEVFNVDKFREFLNDEIEDIEFGKRVVTRSVAERLYSLKSILSKLDKAVQNNEPKGDIGVWDIKFYREDDEGNQTFYEYNGDCSVFSDMVDEDDLTKVQNDEPKDETLKKLTDIVNWVEDKYDGDELREHMIVKTIKEDLLS